MKILVAVDPDDSAFTTVVEAANRLRRRSDQLHFVHIFPRPIEWFRDPGGALEQETADHRADVVAEISKTLARYGLEDSTIDIVVGDHGNAGDDIVEAAIQFGASVIMLGTHGRTLNRGLFVGSVAERVLRAADCDVYVVRAPS